MPTAIFYPVLDNSRGWAKLGLCSSTEHFDCVNEGVDYADISDFVWTNQNTKFEILYSGDGPHPTNLENYIGTDPVTKIRLAIYWKQGFPALYDTRFRVYDTTVTQRGSWDLQLPDSNWTKTRTSWQDVSGLGLTLADFHRGLIEMNSRAPNGEPYVAAIQLELEFTGFLSTSSSSSSASSSSATSSSSSSYYPGLTELGGMVSLKLQQLIDAVEAGKRLIPIAKMEVEDTETGQITTITDVLNFSVSSSSEPSADSFSVSIANVEKWSPRGSQYADLLIASQERRVRLFGGYRLDGVDYYIPFFEGVPAQDQLYIGGRSRTVLIRGYGKERLLLKTNGYRAAYYGYAKDLVKWYLEQAGIEKWWFGFADYYIDGIEMAFTNAYQAVSYILDTPGNIEYFFDGEGVFIAQEYGGTQEPELTLRDSNNLLYLSRYTYADKIVTVADVSGATDAASATRYASQDDLDRYGRSLRIFSSDFITTQAEAEEWGDSIIAESLLYENTVQLRMPFMPYVRGGSIVTIYDAASNTLNENVRLKKVSVYFQAGQTSRIDATGVVV